MAKKLQTIYEYFSDYSESDIENVIFALSIEDKVIIRERYGDDLHHPITSDKWTSEKSSKFYGSIIPKMKKMLIKKMIENPDKRNTEQITNSFDLGINRQLIDLIENGKSNNEICEALNISSNQLYNLLLNLKNRGLMFSRKYYSDASIKYNTIRSITDLKDLKSYNQDRTIITDVSENTLRCLLISDLHFGNKLDRLDLIDRAFNYAVKNGINIILSGGDLIDGSFSLGEQRLTDLYDQLEYFIKNYPQDKSIITFSVAGDHDISAFNNESWNIIDLCENYRQDIVIGGYNNMGVNIKNDQILLFHHIHGGSLRKNNDASILLHGHSHQFKTTIIDDKLNVSLPSLSSINQAIPSVLDLSLSFENGYIKTAVIKQIYLGKNQENVLNEVMFPITNINSLVTSPVRNVEEFKKQKADEKVKVLSQIEKFNKKWK